MAGVIRNCFSGVYHCIQEYAVLEARRGPCVNLVEKEGKTYRVATVTIQRHNEIALENFNIVCELLNAQRSEEAARIRKAAKTGK